MIVPATLAGIRVNLCRGQSAQYGAGAAGSGRLRRRGLRPLVGGILLEHFYWGSVFLINVPIVLVVIAINAKVVPRQRAPRTAAQSTQALVLIAAILMLVFSAKSALKASWRCGSPRWWRSAGRRC